MKTIQLICEGAVGFLFAAVIGVFMLLAGLVLTIPELPQVIRTHSM